MLDPFPPEYWGPPRDRRGPCDADDGKASAAAGREFSPVLAVLSALFVFGGPTLGLAMAAAGALLDWAGLATGIPRAGPYGFLPAPFLCVVGVLLGHKGYRRYVASGQALWATIAAVSLGFGWAGIVLGCCGMTLLLMVFG